MTVRKKLLRSSPSTIATMTPIIHSSPFKWTILEQMALHRVENPGWDFRELFDTRAFWYRTLMVICMAFFVTSFLPAMLNTARIQSSSTRLLLNAINPFFSLGGAIYGATLLDKLGRRKMLFYGLFGAMLSYVALTALTAESSSNPELVYGVSFSFTFSVSPSLGGGRHYRFCTVMMYGYARATSH
ncbi:hypothetical protein VC83_09079 [Pseudogymnoascus destructans]|uniref:Major facilitator superfamily (MFS) profile domain-containing protein n=1 Tax=Pseudogymnoascus destructans TaxID=655981 RepID=A0A176ZXJ1_9PEZI|nr:uncharacterized protein VC83_09079 [Pseudogymnoascus destructans]OAF54608.1 hypothetical protein VC83_09079 [Pseudogymnoascus destructans]